MSRICIDKTIDIKNGIIDNCPNYDSITNFAIPRKDFISVEIKNKYVDFITDNILRNDELKNIKRLDEILGEYIKKGKFYKIIQKTYNKPLTDEDGNEYIFDFYDLMDYLYSSFEAKTIITPKKGTRWL